MQAKPRAGERLVKRAEVKAITEIDTIDHAGAVVRLWLETETGRTSGRVECLNADRSEIDRLRQLATHILNIEASADRQLIGQTIGHRWIYIDLLERRRDFVVAADPVGIVFRDEAIGRGDPDAELEIVGLAPQHKYVRNDGVLSAIAAFEPRNRRAIEQHRTRVVIVDHRTDSVAADDQLIAIEQRHAGRIGVDRRRVERRGGATGIGRAGAARAFVANRKSRAVRGIGGDRKHGGGQCHYRTRDASNAHFGVPRRCPACVDGHCRKAPAPVNAECHLSLLRAPSR